MKRIYLLFLLFFIICTSFVHSFGIGMTEDIREINFEPNLEKEITFVALNRGLEYIPYVEGDLAKYTSLSEPEIIDDQMSTFVLTIKFPEMIEERGTHIIYIGVAQKNPETGGFGISMNVRRGINIKVPYVGKYITLGLSTPNANIGETIKIEASASNLGEEDVMKAKADFNILDSDNNSIKTLYTSEKPILSKLSAEFTAYFNTSGHKAGNYRVIATLNWDGNQSLAENSFKIGSLNVAVINYTREIKKGVINRFDIITESGWNSPVDNLYAEVKATDGIISESFRTPSYYLDPWARINLTGYLDATRMESKEYDAEITLYYSGITTVEKGKIRLTEEKKSAIPWAAILILLAVLVILIIIVNIFIIKRNSNKPKSNK